MYGTAYDSHAFAFVSANELYLLPVVLLSGLEPMDTLGFMRGCPGPTTIVFQRLGEKYELLSCLLHRGCCRRVSGIYPDREMGGSYEDA